MTLSVFDLFSVGIGPSSSHTVGPMRAAARFADALATAPRADEVAALRIELFGSLGATGHGHGTPTAVLLGLEGADPATVNVDGVEARVAAIRASGVVRVAGRYDVAFDPDRDIVLHRRRTLPAHPNGMDFVAFDGAGRDVLRRRYYSVGGGFVVDEAGDQPASMRAANAPARYPFTTAAELLRHCADGAGSIADVMLANELGARTRDEVRSGLLALWQVMQACVERGGRQRGTLPGGLKVPRRAADLRDKLAAATYADGSQAIDWLTFWALAVNEENAAGGRIVTAPTNGAAGIVPAVLHYLVRFVPGAGDDAVVTFLLTAAAIGIVIKENASISGAEVGCQGEVGSACAMAAAGLCAALGGTPAQVENAAEIGIEHHLGLTCDPIGGLVQIPCIERNAVAAVQAVAAARMALHGDGRHVVSLDKVLKTMRETGADMKVKYKETARGGLAVNVVEC
jgi:L-serine dehydratase